METPGTMATQGTMATPGTMATLLYILQLTNFRPVAMYLRCHVDISLLYKNGSFSRSECWDWEERQASSREEGITERRKLIGTGTE